jgi:2-isopropylmalate synthase
MMIKILDSTLREGEQTPGVCFDVHIKMAIAQALDRVGVDIIETGHPAVTSEIRQAVTEISRQGLKAKVGAHARSMESDVDLALECGAGFLGVFYCISDQRLEHHSRNLTQAIDQITHVIAYARERKPDLLIRYTPEDTVRSPWSNVIAAASQAVKAGANIISVADTTGYMIPGTERSMYDYIKKLKDELAAQSLYPELEVHCHNDRGLALANALDGFRAGASIIDTAVLNLGERTGIVDLATLLAVLTVDFNQQNPWQLKELLPLYHLVSRFANTPIPAAFPIAGSHAFTHCAGVHTQAALKNPVHYQSLDPELFGRHQHIALDHMSGISAIKYSLEQIGCSDCDNELCQQILSKVKEVGQMGRIVDLFELKYIVSYLLEKRKGKL